MTEPKLTSRILSVHAVACGGGADIAGFSGMTPGGMILHILRGDASAADLDLVEGRNTTHVRFYDSASAVGNAAAEFLWSAVSGGMLVCGWGIRAMIPRLVDHSISGGIDIPVDMMPGNLSAQFPQSMLLDIELDVYGNGSAGSCIHDGIHTAFSRSKPAMRSGGMPGKDEIAAMEKEIAAVNYAHFEKSGRKTMENILAGMSDLATRYIGGGYGDDS